MNIQPINSHNELINSLKEFDKSYLLLYKDGSEQSDCAFQNLNKISEEVEDIGLFSANVATVRDIHTEYGVTTVPSLLGFEKSSYKNLIKGCHDGNYLKAVFESAVYSAKMKKEGKTPKSVTVYSTPSCSWCNTIKLYLRKNKIPFRDVDVSRDESAAQAMVRKSGQQGVPQTEINGRIVVGFDQKKLNELLEIKPV